MAYVVKEEQVVQFVEYLAFVDWVDARSHHRDDRDARQVETIQISMFANPSDVGGKQTDSKRLSTIM